MELKEMTVEQIEQRMADIPAEVEAANDVATVEERTAELKSLKAELEERANIEKAKAEARMAVANGAGTTIEERKETKMEEKRTFGIDSAEYRTAFMKSLMGKEMTAEERTGMDSGTGSGGYAIPTVTANKIITNLVQIYPLIGEIDLMQIPGNVTLLVEGTVADPAKHTENASISVSEDTLVRIQLSGYEYCKTIQISAKLALMSIDAFEGWIVEQLTRKLGELIEDRIVNGDGSSNPKGFNALSWTTSGSGQNAVDWASTAPTVAELETQMGLMNAAYLSNAKWIMNWSTFMTKIHVLRDDKKEQVFERVNGQYFVFGFPVVFSSKVADGAIFFGDLKETVKANFAQPITVESSDAAGFERNCRVFRGTCIFDCNVVSGRMTKSAASF